MLSAAHDTAHSRLYSGCAQKYFVNKLDWRIPSQGRGCGSALEHHNRFFLAGVVVPQEPAVFVPIYAIGVVQNRQLI